MDPSASDVPARHRAVVQALRRFTEASEHAVDLAGRGLGLHRTDVRALSILTARRTQGRTTTAGDLGAQLHLTRAATTAVVDRLVASGHARRARSPQDGRRVLVEPTPSAVADGAAAFGPLAARIGAALAAFDAAELDAALRVVDAAAAAAAVPPPTAPDPETTPGRPA